MFIVPNGQTIALFQVKLNIFFSAEAKSGI